MKNALLAPSRSIEAPPASVPPRATRVDAVDLLRGLVMVVMLLDHTREYMHRDAALFDPTNLTRTTLALFLTRWVTHLCAPTFVLLAGTGAALQLRRGKSPAELARFLVTRGLWLVVLEFTVIRLGLAFDLDYAAFPGILSVIWAIGVSMLVLALFVRLPVAASAVVGVAIIALHNLTDGFFVQAGPEGPGAAGALWMVLHQPGFIRVFGAPMLVAYPVLPWIGVMLAGYALGSVYGWEAERRRRFLLRAGAAMIAGFVLLRASNLYGNPAPWSVQKDSVFTVLSFVNTNKYPPSLLFLLMTLGPALLALAWLERARLGAAGSFLLAFGRVPLFFYLVQWFVAHGIGLGLSLLAGKPTAHLFGFPSGTPPAPGGGFGLGMTYFAWLLGIAITYPLCRWFAGVKRRHPSGWLSYL